MNEAKKRSEQHLIDQGGQQLLRSKLPAHWVLREYRPDYGLDYSLEVFKEADTSGKFRTYETLPDRTAGLLFHFLRQNGGALSQRAREQEFREFTVEEIQRAERAYTESSAVSGEAL